MMRVTFENTPFYLQPGKLNPAGFASFPSQPNIASFRSRIIEEFEARRGLVLVGSEQGPAGGAPVQFAALAHSWIILALQYIRSV